MVSPDATGQQSLQQGLALGHREGRAFARGAKNRDAIAARCEHALGMGNGAWRVQGAIGAYRHQQGWPQAVNIWVQVQFS